MRSDAKLSRCGPFGGKRAGGGICRPGAIPPRFGGPRSTDSLAAIVRCYIEEHREGAKEELQYFAGLPTVEEAVRLASLARTSTGMRHPHHQRRTQNSLNHALRSLSRCPVSDCATFDELMGCVDEAIRHIYGIGELFVYDAALAIGARLGLEPERVYLHAGTRDGARHLGLGRGRKSLEIDELPRAFRRLRPREIEDCLCIYEERLGDPALLR